MLLVQLTQKLMEDKLMYISEVQVSVALESIHKINLHTVNPRQLYRYRFRGAFVYGSMTEFGWNV
jgi:hypothetical protein